MYALLANRGLPYRQRRHQFQMVLGNRKTVIEAYMTAGFQRGTVWDSKSFDAALERSWRLAGDLGRTGPVGITRPLGPLQKEPFCTFRPAAPDISGAVAKAMAWPALRGYQEFDTAAMLREARARIRLPAIGDFVQQLQTKCKQLANIHFLMLRCELRWLNNQRD